MSKGRICIVDKTEYQYCPNCPGYNPSEKWRFVYCSDNCKKIYEACEGFRNGTKSALIAYGELMTLDLSGKDGFTLPLQKDIDEIYATVAKTSSKKTTKKKTTKKIVNELEQENKD